MDIRKPKIEMIFQVAVVTDDLERTIENWKELLHFDTDSIVIKNTKDSFDAGEWNAHNYNEKYCEFYNKFASIDMGGVDLEIIEPMDKAIASPFADYLRENGTSIHHIGVKIDDMELMDKKMKELGVKRLNYGEGGPVLSNGVKKSCVFYDLRPYIGVILECCSIVKGPRSNEPIAKNPPELLREKKNDYLHGFEPDPTRPSMNLIFQIGTCVSDLHKSLQNWRNLFDFDESRIVIKSTKKSFENDGWDGLNYNEKKCGFFHQLCRFGIGGLDMEIIEPFDKTPGNPYSDFLRDHGWNIHHLGVKIGNLDLLKKNMAEKGKPRFNYAEMGPVLADGSRKSCVFYDFREEIGCIFEAGSVVVGPLSTDPRAENPADFVSD